jgi:hypothetical protein
MSDRRTRVRLATEAEVNEELTLSEQLFYLTRSTTHQREGRGKFTPLSILLPK